MKITIKKYSYLTQISEKIVKKPSVIKMASS